MSSFQLSFIVLYAIGLKTYLRLEVGASQIHAQYPMYATLDTRTPFAFFLRDYHPLWYHFPENFE